MNVQKNIYVFLNDNSSKVCFDYESETYILNSQISKENIKMLLLPRNMMQVKVLQLYQECELIG